MARVPDSEIERIKREVPISRLVEAAGVALKPHGDNLIGLCPFHDDHDPSLVVTPSKNLWHCLGACRTGGSVIDWIMRERRISFRHAADILLHGTPGKGSHAVAAETSARPSAPSPPPPVDEGRERDALRWAVAYYHETLKRSDEALAYLKKRGLHTPDMREMIDRFRLGFANRTLGYRLPPKDSNAGKETRAFLQATGLLRESGHEHFNGSLVIPILDEDSEVCGIYGRKVTPNLRAGTPLHMYLPGPHRGVWNIEALKVSKEIILCEALIDALTFWVHGLHNVTASYGVEGFTPDHLDAFKRYGTRRVLIAYDRDEAGDGAARALARKLAAQGIECWRVQFPHGMDANEFALKVQPAGKSLALAVHGALKLDKEGNSMNGPGSGGGGSPSPRTGGGPSSSGTGPSSTAAISDTGDEAAKERSPELVPAPAPAPTGDDQELPASITSTVIAPATDEERLSSLAASTPLERSVPQQTAVSPAEMTQPSSIPAEMKGEEVTVRLGDRRYRVRGLSKNLSYDQLRVNVLAGTEAAYHVDTFDLYSARHRAVFIRQTAEELGLEEETVRKDLGKVLLKLEELQDRQIRETLKPKNPQPVIPQGERDEALALLKDHDLTGRILADFIRCGVVGEETNKLTGYLAAVSRKLDAPLAVVVQSSTAAGKSALMEAVLNFMPEEERVHFSAMTGQSLYYMGDKDLRHKILAVSEEEGAARAAYALKLLQSEGRLTIASTGKDATSGRLVTHEYEVKGPVMLFMTTTAPHLDEELLNRCIVLGVSEERDQTRAIHHLQRQSQTLEGVLARRERERIVKRHHNAQRLLQPLTVVNPWASRLTFLDDRTRTRRDHAKYLTLIRAITLLHQHQRPVHTLHHGGEEMRYIEVTPDDIKLANTLAHEILGRSLDELAPQTRRLLLMLDAMVTAACARKKLDRPDYRFSRRDVREHTGWSDFQARVHLTRLVELEYVLVHRGGRGQSFVYELLYDGKGKDGRPFLSNLLDHASLRLPATTETPRGEETGSRGQTTKFEGSSSPQQAPSVGPLSALSIGVEPSKDADSGPVAAKVPENAHLDAETSDPSHAVSRHTVLAAPEGRAV